jgi:hypothetical protein
VVGRQVHYATAPVPDLVRIETFVTYLWYGVGAGDGLRSVGVEALPPSKGACSILPTARHFRAGALGHFTRPGWSEGRGIALRLSFLFLFTRKPRREIVGTSP